MAVFFLCRLLYTYTSTGWTIFCFTEKQETVYVIIIGQVAVMDKKQQYMELLSRDTKLNVARRREFEIIN